jgi:hypothetical protein
LGRHRVPRALRGLGWAIRTHHEVFGDRDEEIRDVEWLELVAEAFPARERHLLQRMTVKLTVTGSERPAELLAVSTAE